jgi:hypothetical protein
VSRQPFIVAAWVTLATALALAFIPAVLVSAAVLFVLFLIAVVVGAVVFIISLIAGPPVFATLHAGQTIHRLAQTIKARKVVRRVTKRKGKSREHLLVATAVALLFTIALIITVFAVHPEQKHLPNIAYRSVPLFKFEVFIALFYGGLLILLPLYRGVVSGLLPDEISLRGAKFTREVTTGVEKLEDRIHLLETEGDKQRREADVQTQQVGDLSLRVIAAEEALKAVESRSAKSISTPP